jgi:hypothetical protein
MPPRKATPKAPLRAGPDDVEQQQLLRSLERAQVKAEAVADAKAIAAAKVAVRELPPANYAVRDTTLPVVSPDMAQVILAVIRGRVPNAVAALNKARNVCPDLLREMIHQYRLEGERRPEIFLALLERVL